MRTFQRRFFKCMYINLLAYNSLHVELQLIIYHFYGLLNDERTVKFIPMVHLFPISTTYITPYLTLILINLAFKWLTIPWLSISRPYLSISKLNKGYYRRSNLETNGPMERTLRYCNRNLLASPFVLQIHLNVACSTSFIVMQLSLLEW